MPSLGQGIWFLLLFIGAPQDNATERARGAKANQDSWQMWPYQQQIVIDSFRLVNDANFQRLKYHRHELIIRVLFFVVSKSLEFKENTRVRTWALNSVNRSRRIPLSPTLYDTVPANCN